MIDFSEATADKIIFHRISKEESDNIVNNSMVEINNIELVRRVFLKPFGNDTNTQEFSHEIDLEQNTLYKLVKSIYDGENFVPKSKQIHKYLKSVSTHPNIKDGDLFVIKFDDVKINNKFHEAVGIYKIETKESFIETGVTNKGETELNLREGINGRKLDKACLIIFTKIPYTLFIIDSSTTETDYWRSDFINAISKNDSSNNTSQFLNMAKAYVTKQLPNEFEVNKPEQIDMLNRSMEYFKTHEEFDKKDFEKKVLYDTEIIKSFRKFDEDYQERHEIAIEDNFQISAPAVKKKERAYKSVLKLDTNFHIYIHGNRELIEQGVEKDGRKYYKIYFEEEQ